MLRFHDKIMFTLSSCVRGYHIYRDAWNPSVGETVNVKAGILEDPHAVALWKDGVTNGHVPLTISLVCTLFLRHGGTIQCTVTGQECIWSICCREEWSCLVRTNLRYS